MKLKNILQALSKNFIYNNLFYIYTSMDFRNIKQIVNLASVCTDNVLIVYLDNINTKNFKKIASLNCICKKIYVMQKNNVVYSSNIFFNPEEVISFTPILINEFIGITLHKMIENIFILLINSSINSSIIFSIVDNISKMSVFKLQS